LQDALLDVSRFRVKPGEKVDIAKLDPDGESSVEVRKGESKDETKKLTKKLDNLQEMLYAEHKHKLLIVLQAMDTGGKDGVIRHIFEGVNPAGVRVAHFREPSQDEKDHGFLWRAYAQIPADGEMVVFNRSHYEGVLVERVHNIVPKAVWKERFEEINEFEKLLTQQNVTILKFFLNIDSDEQKKRIEERLEDPTKEWKFSEDDPAERKFWNDYMKAYEDVLNKTSTDYSPWFAIPSNHHWLRNLIVSTVLVETLESFRMNYPRLPDSLRRTKIPAVSKK
jgi:PPK2 family polyphosphate:nucleotide phosphotransferase